MTTSAVGPSALTGHAAPSTRIDPAALATANSMLGGRAALDAPLGPLTTYRVGGAAALYVVADSIDVLESVGAASAASGLDVLALGRGSNLLVADRGFAGIVVALGAWATTITVSDDVVTAGGAVSLPVLARRTAQASLTGLEWAVGVPGSVGGAVRMNAGGHGSDMAASLRRVRVLDLVTGENMWMDSARLELRFRGSALGDDQIVLDASFELGPGHRLRAESEIAEIVRWRRDHQPGGQNAGSVFVNPVPGVLSAGQVIDEVGLRGFRLGTARISERHANFIQADENGSADDVKALMDAVRDRVLAERGIALRSENRLVGFADDTIDSGDGR